MFQNAFQCWILWQVTIILATSWERFVFGHFLVQKFVIQLNELAGYDSQLENRERKKDFFVVDRLILSSPNTRQHRFQD